MIFLSYKDLLNFYNKHSTETTIVHSSQNNSNSAHTNTCSRSTHNQRYKKLNLAARESTRNISNVTIMEAKSHYHKRRETHNYWKGFMLWQIGRKVMSLPLVVCNILWEVGEAIVLLSMHHNHYGQMGAQPVRSLFFMNNKVLKVLSSSTLPNTLTTTICTTFRYLESLCCRRLDAFSRC